MYGSYDLDSLRKIVRDLEEENNRLREQLIRAGIEPVSRHRGDENSFISEEFDPDQGGRILDHYITKEDVNRFASRFWGRMDVFAKRGNNGGYYPQCANRWNDRCPIFRKECKHCPEDCVSRKWIPLSINNYWAHLLNKEGDKAYVIGVYPLLSNGNCRFLVFDFDDHEEDKNISSELTLQQEVNALCLICEKNNVSTLTERSRSGHGAHVWIFFKEEIPASKVRNFAFLLLEKGMASVNLPAFRYYDRMRPAQDVSVGLGDCIAVPLQGQALKAGNSAFVDKSWNAYPDQWKVLLECPRMTQKELNEHIADLEKELPLSVLKPEGRSQRPRPWNRHDDFSNSDVIGKMHIILADGIYVDAINLKPRIQNQIRCLAVLNNPQYFKNLHMHRSNWDTPSAVYLGEDINGYIHIPRGLLDQIEERCKKSQIDYEIVDKRQSGRPISVDFNGELYIQQQLAAADLLKYDSGILDAATAFGKTVVASYLIAQRGVSTLILLNSRQLADQWKSQLETFLNIHEELPVRVTKSGRKKRAKSVIGELMSGKTDTLTGIVDIALVGSVYHNGEFHEKLTSYGMVIMDECHHAASETAQRVLTHIKAKYVYGVSATPVRADHLEKINYWLLGPIRHSYSAKERALQQGIDHLVKVRFSRTASPDAENMGYIDACEITRHDVERNQMIIEDVRNCLQEGRTPVILTKFKSQAKELYDNLKEDAQHAFLLYGDQSEKDNRDAVVKLKKVSPKETMLIVATAQKIGEGFDCPRLDTLFLVSPVSDPGRLTQYVGRLNRDYPSKKNAIVYDYVDINFPVFEKMYHKRMKTYKKIGYGSFSDVKEKQNTGAIFDNVNYLSVFERDITDADQEVIISSPEISSDKIDRLIYLLRGHDSDPLKCIVITVNPDNTMAGSSDYCLELLRRMQGSGVKVICSETYPRCFAIIDRKIVWYGSLNFLGKEDYSDNLIREKDPIAVNDLLELTFGKEAVADAEIHRMPMRGRAIAVDEDQKMKNK